MTHPGKASAFFAHIRSGGKWENRSPPPTLAAARYARHNLTR